MAEFGHVKSPSRVKQAVASGAEDTAHQRVLSFQASRTHDGSHTKLATVFDEDSTVLSAYKTPTQKLGHNRKAKPR